MLQVNSYYGLLSTKEIKLPKLTHGKMDVPFFSGFRYAAYPAMKSEEVNNDQFLDIILNQNLKQAGTYALFSERPAMLIYHEKCYHVMDMKVIKVKIDMITIILYFSHISAHWHSGRHPSCLIYIKH